ncbi:MULTISPECIES: LysR family transcriptional regulator [unclassified Halomonas]|uniref:LysR family transcriptional regulator n=1 Tax=unclassified Halomonas TaxID=2609666 RepID=UPI001C961B11|nr:MULTISPECIES: LysR family transcriptional regulator [unclassified Halomonas]MBY5927073.1 LysR family transcriptional regulator [Halomonas sp. DP4Y7-2]MBY6234115.1 LysR family transcriptional regulator [Halomonas sp. DP4Y7-1]
MAHDSGVHVKTWLRVKHMMLLVALDESRNMHAAARQLNISQPAASKMLKDIEGFLGLPLFEREPGRMEPTAAGETVLRYARRLLNDTDRLVEELSSLREGGHGRLALGSVPGAAPVMLPHAMAALKRQRPRLAISLMENSSDRLLVDLEYKLLDAVIGRYTDPSQRHLFDFLPLKEEPVSVVARPEHPLCQGVPELAELVRWPWVLHPMASPMRGLFEAALAEAGVASPRNVIETTSTQASLQLVASSDTLSVLPSSVVKTAFSQGRFAVLPLTIGEPLGYYGILTRKNEPWPQALKELVQELTG